MEWSNKKLKIILDANGSGKRIISDSVNDSVDKGPRHKCFYAVKLVVEAINDECIEEACDIDVYYLEGESETEKDRDDNCSMIKLSFDLKKRPRKSWLKFLIL